MRQQEEWLRQKGKALRREVADVAEKAERGERLNSLEGATQQMALQAESLASMATQLKEREQSRSMFPWS